MSARIASASDLGVLATLRRGVQISPQMVQGIGLTLVLAVLAAGGRVVVPLAVQSTIDHGILAAGGPDAGRVALMVGLAALALLAAGTCSGLVNRRLVRRTEAGLAALRVRAFRHVHDLATLTQSTERSGALVSRVTSDVDTITQFVQSGGIMLIVSTLQIAVATVLMVIYSWELALIVWACFVPLYLVMRFSQKAVSRRFTRVRERFGTMLAAISEAVVGAETVRAYGVTARTGRRMESAIESTRQAQGRAQRLVATMFASGTLLSNLALAAVVVVGARLGMDGRVTAGQVVAFLFLVQLFTGPVQQATEILNDLQNAVAGWRRVLAVIETDVEVAEAPDAVASPRGPAQVSLHAVRFAYPGGPDVLHGVDLELPARAKVAVVGQTGSGKTTIAKLATRLMDPTAGAVHLDGTDLRALTLASLRERVVLVPQEGFLFDGTVLENAAYGLRASRVGEAAAGSAADVEAAVLAAFDALGLTDWVSDLPQGVRTPVGQRGESLSAGERQLVAIARAYLAQPDLLVLDEATSAVDPATEVRIARALDSLTSGRSTITIAHRLSTAEASDLVVVVDKGHVVEVGPHAELAAADGVYSRMHAAWVTQTR
ncbi:MAG: ABC transporter ATP-binding protein/permease [Promicromonosporaceae bacterium]|nr:ABC transporter ATP-binding protein/permease [Promicromonosporaceae bacterium]